MEENIAYKKMLECTSKAKSRLRQALVHVIFKSFNKIKYWCLCI